MKRGAFFVAFAFFVIPALAQPEGEEEGPLEARRQGQEGGQGQNPPEEVAHQGEEPHPPSHLLLGEDPPHGEGGEEGQGGQEGAQGLLGQPRRLEAHGGAACRHHQHGVIAAQHLVVHVYPDDGVRPQAAGLLLHLLQG